jgi:hypothetical protein
VRVPKDPMPSPFARGARVLHRKRTRQLHMACPGRQVGAVLLFDHAEMLAKRTADPKREQLMRSFWPFVSPNEQVTGREVDVPHANACTFK